MHALGVVGTLVVVECEGEGGGEEPDGIVGVGVKGRSRTW